MNRGERREAQRGEAVKSWGGDLQKWNRGGRGGAVRGGGITFSRGLHLLTPRTDHDLSIYSR